MIKVYVFIAISNKSQSEIITNDNFFHSCFVDIFLCFIRQVLRPRAPILTVFFLGKANTFWMLLGI